VSDAPEVLTEVDGNVLIVTINRPDAKNAMTKAAAEGIAAAMDRLDAETDLRCAILTGAGGTFCSGMDLKGFLRGERPSVPGRGFGGLSQWTPKKPIIAAVDGYALAGGMELALSCDLVVASKGSKFGIPEAKRGLAAAAGGLIKLPRQIPPRIAMELALTGDFIDAERAYALGMVNALAERDGLLAAAQALAARITVNAPVAVRHSLGVARQALDLSDAELMAESARSQALNMTSEDFKEGPRAFIEKRAPRWTGR